MALAHTTIDDLIIGSPLDISRSIKLAATDGILEKCWFTCKENRTKGDDEALIKVSITTASTASGEITNAGASGTGEFIFHLLRADTLKFEFGKVYIFDIWVKTSLFTSAAGTETGVIIPHYAVTLDPT